MDTKHALDPVLEKDRYDVKHALDPLLEKDKIRYDVKHAQLGFMRNVQVFVDQPKHIFVKYANSVCTFLF